MALDPPATAGELANLLDYKIGKDDPAVILSRETAREIAAHLRDAEKYRAHSVKLNAVAWKIAAAIGEVGPGETEHWGDVDADLDRLIARVS